MELKTKLSIVTLITLAACYALIVIAHYIDFKNAIVNEAETQFNIRFNSVYNISMLENGQKTLESFVDDIYPIIRLTKNTYGLIYIIDSDGNNLLLDRFKDTKILSNMKDNYNDILGSGLFKKTGRVKVGNFSYIGNNKKEYINLFSSFSYDENYYIFGYITSNSYLNGDFFNYFIFLSILFLFVYLINYIFISLILSNDKKLKEYILETLKSANVGEFQPPQYDIENGYLGDLGALVNSNIELYSNLISKIKDNTVSNGRLKSDLKNLFNIAYDDVAALSENVFEIKKSVDSISKNISLSDSSILKINDDIGDLHHNISQSINLRNNTGSTLKSMNKSINELTELIDNKDSSLKVIVENAGKNQKVISSFADGAYEINKKADEITSVLGLINSITAKTSMLAMNAAIQAAHAGEYGKGFSVVAGEIQKLAEASQEGTKKISEIVKDLANYVSKVNEDSKESTSIFENNLKEIQAQLEVQTQAKNMLKGVSVFSKNAALDLDRLNELSSDIKIKSSNTSDGIVKIKEQNSIIKTLLDKCVDILKTSEDSLKFTTKEMNDIKNIITKFKSNSSEIVHLLSNFLNISEKEILNDMENNDDAEDNDLQIEPLESRNFDNINQNDNNISMGSMITEDEKHLFDNDSILGIGSKKMEGFLLDDSESSISVPKEKVDDAFLFNDDDKEESKEESPSSDLGGFLFDDSESNVPESNTEEVKEKVDDAFLFNDDVEEDSKEDKDSDNTASENPDEELKEKKDDKLNEVDDDGIMLF